MAAFEFPYHTVATDYPESGFQINLGNSYSYAVGATSPDQRTFTLKFPTMKYFVNAQGQVDATIHPDLNMKALEDHYNAHKRHITFTYDHPVYGVVNVRYRDPLRIPEGIKGGGGALKDFQIVFVEVP